MAFSVTMPALGESVSEGTVTRWLKREGEEVSVDEPLLEVSTDKVDTEIPSPAAGVLQRIVVPEDETVEVGAELAVIGDAAEAGSPDGGGAPAAQEHAEPAVPQPQQRSEQAEQPPQPPQEEPEPGVGEGTAPYGGAPAEVAPPSEQPATAPSPEQEQGGQQDGGTGGGAASGTAVTMPALGESVAEGTVTRWLKSVGDRVEMDEPLLEVSTDKVDTEIPSPVAGTLLSIAVDEDETVPVGAQLAVVGEAGAAAPQAPQPSGQQPSEQPASPQQPPRQEAPPSPAPQAESTSPPAVQAAPVVQSAPAPQSAQPREVSVPEAAPAGQEQPAGPAAQGDGGTTEDKAAYVTPLVRKLAAENGVDLAALTGTGVGGRIRKQDVLEAARSRRAEPRQPAAQQPSGAGQAAAGAPAPASPKRGTREKMSRLRKVIATHMVESLQTSAQLTTVVEADLTRIAVLRERAKRDFEAREGVRLSFLPFLAKAAVDALKVHPKVNASIEGDEIVYSAGEHLGIAVDTDRGLLVPVIKDAGDLNLAGLARRISDLAERTRNNKITPDELTGGTFTLTNTGSRGALFDTPIINQPQVGILGTGAVIKRPVVVETDLGETIAIRSIVYLALSYDHRLVDGADAARFLATVKERLEEGAFAAELGL